MTTTVQTSLEQRWMWADVGACKGKEDLFFHGDEEPKGLRRRKEVEAKAVCAGCAVLEECRRYAMESSELYGVWGGLTENERHRLAVRHRSG